MLINNYLSTLQTANISSTAKKRKLVLSLNITVFRNFIRPFKMTEMPIVPSKINNTSFFSKKQFLVG